MIFTLILVAACTTNAPSVDTPQEHATPTAGAHDHAERDHAQHPHTETAPREGSQAWVCPMHPEVTSDKAGSCPECGMDLVEAEAPPAADPHAH